MPTVTKVDPEAAQRHWTEDPPPPEKEYIYPNVPEVLPTPASVLVVWVDPQSLAPAPWNPPHRTTRAKVSDLIKRMLEVGFEPFRPILVSNDGFIGDGHRRWTAAKYLGMPLVPVIYTDKSVQELWAGNEGARPPKSRDWMAAHIHGGVPIGNARIANPVHELHRLLGEEGIRYLVDRGVAPDIYRTVWRVGLHCQNTTDKFMRATVYWLVKHRMVDKTNKAVWGPEDDRIDPRVLRQAIESDLPLRATWQVG